mmetsp:Transcript_3927/g.7932  ORF Transcript_3927/g.7932 Transcript_3927/m.7932 type:complete len:299 (-) Transcript_3927:149-1045(-)
MQETYGRALLGAGSRATRRAWTSGRQCRHTCFPRTARRQCGHRLGRPAAARRRPKHCSAGAAHCCGASWPQRTWRRCARPWASGRARAPGAPERWADGCCRRTPTWPWAATPSAACIACSAARPTSSRRPRRCTQQWRRWSTPSSGRPRRRAAGSSCRRHSSLLQTQLRMHKVGTSTPPPAVPPSASSCRSLPYPRTADRRSCCPGRTPCTSKNSRCESVAGGASPRSAPPTAPSPRPRPRRAARRATGPPATRWFWMAGCCTGAWRTTAWVHPFPCSCSGTILWIRHHQVAAASGYG